MHLRNSTSLWRWPTATLLTATAGIHLTLVPDHLREAPYAGVMFIALSTAALVAAIAVPVTNHAIAWLAAGTVSLSATIAFCLSRSIGLPGLSDDIGDWLNPLGLAALGCEISVVLICWRVVHAQPHRLAGVGEPVGDDAVTRVGRG